MKKKLNNEWISIGYESIEITTQSNPLEELSFEEMSDKIVKEELKEITIPSSIKIREKEVLAFCYTLIQITSQSTVTSIQYKTFAFYKTLAEITIPSSVTSIE